MKYHPFSNIELSLFDLFLVSWQLGLVEREINDLLRGSLIQQQRQQQQQQKPRWMKNQEETAGKTMLQQREISEDDVCPICQDELLAKHMPVTFCKYVYIVV